jgi:hypothetical protein
MHHPPDCSYQSMKKKKYLKRILLLLLFILITPFVVAFLAITFYKKELTDLLIAQAKETYGLNIRIHDTRVSLFENWPNASIEIKDVQASTDQAPASAPLLLQAQSISISFNLVQLLSKKFVVNSVSIKHGTISLIKDRLGNPNFKIKEQKGTAKASSPVQFNLHKINITDLKLDFKNEEHEKHIGIVFRNNVIRLQMENKIVKANLTGNIKIEELLFKPSKGPFLKNTEAVVYLNTTLYPNHPSLFVDESSYAIIDEEKYSLVSFVQLHEEKKLTLQIKAPHADFKKGIRLMNERIRFALSKISVTNPVAIDATIIAPIGKSAEPELYITMSGNNNDITIGNTEIPYHHVSFNGYLRSMGDKGQTEDLSNGAVVFKNVKGLVYDFPFTATVAINDLKNASIKIKADIHIQGSKIKLKPGNDLILDGVCLANVNYSGDVKHLNNDEFLDAPQQLLLKVKFKRFSYRTAPDQPAYIIDGDAEGLNKDISFKNIKLETVGGNFVIEGNASDFVPYAFGRKDGFNATVRAFTDELNLTPMIAKSFTGTGQQQTSSLKKQDVKDAMEGAFIFKMGLRAKKLIIRNLVATDAEAEINYANKTIDVSRLTMKACDGNLSATGKLHNFTTIRANVAIKNMEVKNMFEQFEDFGQKTISSKKLRGSISLTAAVKARLNERFQLLPDMEGEVQLKLKDGHLLEFEPMQNLSPYFRNRDFNDITFSEINQTFKIKGTDMDIQNLEIASNVLNLYIDGIYSFKGQTDLNLRIPLSNLRRRDKDYVPKSLGEEGRTAKSLLLNAHGLPNKIKISLGSHQRDSLSERVDGYKNNKTSKVDTLTF